MDANGYRFLASNNFGTSSNYLLNAFANKAQKLCTYLVETHATEVFLSCLLIQLDKSPGLWTIDICEVLWRTSGKVIVSVPKEYDIKCSDTQAVGQEDAIEAAIHVQWKWCTKMKALIRFH